MSEPIRQFVPQNSASLIEDLCGICGIPFSDPLDTNHVVKLLNKLGYLVDRSVVAEFVRKGYITSPIIAGQWTAQQVHEFMAGLEWRRRWQVGSAHDLKKSGAQLALEQAQLAGKHQYIEDLDQHTIEDMLVLMTLAEQRSVREALLVAVKQKLEVLEFRE